MAWDADGTIIFRAMVDDLDSSKYTDAQIKTYLVSGAFLVNQDIDFPVTYTINVSAETITPEPDEIFLNFILLKTACITDTGAAVKAASQGIAIRDGSSSIDLKQRSKGAIDLLKHGWCKIYNDDKQQYNFNKTASIGKAVLSTFKLYSYK